MSDSIANKIRKNVPGEPTQQSETGIKASSIFFSNNSKIEGGKLLSHLELRGDLPNNILLQRQHTSEFALQIMPYVPLSIEKTNENSKTIHWMLYPKGEMNKAIPFVPLIPSVMDNNAWNAIDNKAKKHTNLFNLSQVPEAWRGQTLEAIAYTSMTTTTGTLQGVAIRTVTLNPLSAQTANQILQQVVSRGLPMAVRAGQVLLTMAAVAATDALIVTGVGFLVLGAAAGITYSIVRMVEEKFNDIPSLEGGTGDVNADGDPTNQIYGNDDIPVYGLKQFAQFNIQLPASEKKENYSVSQLQTSIDKAIGNNNIIGGIANHEEINLYSFESNLEQDIDQNLSIPQWSDKVKEAWKKQEEVKQKAIEHIETNYGNETLIPGVYSVRLLLNSVNQKIESKTKTSNERLTLYRGISNINKKQWDYAKISIVAPTYVPDGKPKPRLATASEQNKENKILSEHTCWTISPHVAVVHALTAPGGHKYTVGIVLEKVFDYSSPSLRASPSLHSRTLWWLKSVAINTVNVVVNEGEVQVKGIIDADRIYVVRRGREHKSLWELVWARK